MATRKEDFKQALEKVTELFDEQVEDRLVAQQEVNKLKAQLEINEQITDNLRRLQPPLMFGSSNPVKTDFTEKLIAYFERKARENTKRAEEKEKMYKEESGQPEDDRSSYYFSGKADSYQKAADKLREVLNVPKPTATGRWFVGMYEAKGLPVTTRNWYEARYPPSFYPGRLCTPTLKERWVVEYFNTASRVWQRSGNKYCDGVYSSAAKASAAMDKGRSSILEYRVRRLREGE